MFDNLGFDPKSLSDDELFSKQLDLIKRKTQAARMGRHDMISQLDRIISVIEIERRERVFLERFAMIPDSPVVLETDPGMQENQKTEQEKIAPKPAQPSRIIRRPVRTAKPVIPTDGA